MTTFNFTTGNPANLTGGAAASMTDIGGSLTDIKTFLNGGNLTDTNIASNGVDNDNLDATTVAAKLGLSQTGTVRRGKSIIATEETRSSTSYGTLTTPDQVSSVVLPTDGLMVVAFSGMLKGSVSLAASAAIFIGSNQLKIAGGTSSSAPAVTSADAGSTTAYRAISTQAAGLVMQSGTVAFTGHVTTGEVVGATDIGAQAGPCYIFAAAGTYDVSIQVKATSGSVSMKERKLWVWALGF